MYRDSWDVMRTGATEKALQQMRDNYAQMPTTCAIELGVGYLWLKDYRAAWEHFDRFNHQYPRRFSGTYGMAGVAKWCMNLPHDAVAQWREGLHAEYADAAGGNMKLPLLLFFASVLAPSIVPSGEIQGLLLKRIEDTRIRVWPGPVVEFILGRIDEARLREQCLEKRSDKRLQDVETSEHHWSADFFVGVLALAKGNASQFREAMKATGSMSWEDYDRSSDLFLGKLWCEEFYLARHHMESQEQEIL